MEILYIVLEVLGILAIICLGAFIIVLVADLILSTFDGHEGVFFHKQPKQQAVTEKQVVVKEEKITKMQVNEPVYGPTVTPYYELQQETIVEEPVEVVTEEVINEVDFQKAAEEQKIINSRKAVIKETPTVVKEEAVFTDVEEADSSAELAKAIEETKNLALKQIELDKKNKINDEKEKELEREKQQQLIREQILREQELLLAKEREESVVTEDVVTVDVVEDGVIDELKRLREDIFSLKRNAFNELQETKIDKHENKMSKDRREFNRLMKEKLKELEDLKNGHAKFQAEKEELLKYKKAAEDKHSELEQLAKEKEELKERLRIMEEEKQDVVVDPGKPYYTKEYYFNRLETLEAELKEVEKELKLNKREYIPLARIKKSYERDREKLRRKEAIVAKQGIAIYSVSAASVDPAKKEKLEEEIKVLNELKESVFNCDQVLKQNKDRYPVLEKANKLLVKTVARLKHDIENVKAAIAWYEQNDNI